MWMAIENHTVVCVSVDNIPHRSPDIPSGGQGICDEAEAVRGGVVEKRSVGAARVFAAQVR